MIAIIVSVLSFLILVIVTVILVNQNIDNESKRKAEMRKIVDQINSANTSAAGIEEKQNATLKDINASIGTLQRSVKSVDEKAASRVELKAAVNSTAGSFDSLNIGSGQNITLASEGNGLAIKGGGTGSNNTMNRIAGFDTLNNNKRVLIGSDLQLLQSGSSNLYTPFDSVGDMFIMTASNNRRLMLQNGVGPGLVIKNNQIGVGMDPKYTTFDVGSNMAILGDLYMGASNPQRAFSSSNGVLQFNKGNGFGGGVNVEGDMAVTGTLTASAWKAAKDDPGVLLRNGNVGIGVEPANAFKLDVGGSVNLRSGALSMGGSNMFALSNGALSMNSQGVPSVIINGRTVNLGGTNFSASNNGTNVFYGGSMKFAAEPKTPQSWDLEVNNQGVTTRQLKTNGMDADNVFAKRSIYKNQANKYWTTYHNNANNFVFVPGQVTLPSSTGGDEGVVRFTAKGDIEAQGSATFEGGLQADASVTSGGDLVGQNICVKNIGGGNTCLNRNHLEYIISQYNTSVSPKV